MKISIFFLMTSLVLIMSLFPLSIVRSQQVVTPISEMLDKNGSINLSMKSNCTIDFNGWKLVLGKKNEPHFIQSDSDDIYWDNQFTGLGGTIYAMIYYKNILYIGGYIETVSNIVVNNIASWDGTKWSGLGSGVDGTVFALTGNGNDLYAGGNFRGIVGGLKSSHIAKWDGSSWSSLASGLDDDVLSLHIWNNTLIAGGYFTNSGGVTLNHIAVWNGISWDSLGSGVNEVVRSISSMKNNLYVGGGFNIAGNVTANRIAMWDGLKWNALGSGMDGDVYALISTDSLLFAGGQFITADGNPVNHIANWDGKNWHSLAEGTNNRVLTLAVVGSMLYVGGLFTIAGNDNANYFAQWDGSRWKKIAVGLGYVYALALKDSNVIISNRSISPIRLWNGTNDISIETDRTPIGRINSFVVYRDTILSQEFLLACGQLILPDRTSTQIMRWDGSRWSSFENRVNGEVRAMKCLGNNLYIGGQFQSIGNTKVNNFAKWDGHFWSPLGQGVNGAVLAIAGIGETLYAVVDYPEPFGYHWYEINKWNGSEWKPIMHDISWAEITCLEMIGSTLYAGGLFTNISGTSASYIAKWDGTNWTALGAGTNDVVYTIKNIGSDLYVGGIFTRAGVHDSANGIAKWNGNDWTTLQMGVDVGYTGGTVRTIVNTSHSLFVAGDFGRQSGFTAQNIAMWDGASWYPLGSGTNDRILHAAIFQNSLFISGDFSVAGNKPSIGIARWTKNIDGAGNNPDVKSFSLNQNYPNPCSHTTTINYFLNRTMHIRLIIRDLMGREIFKLVDDRVQEGKHSIELNTSSLTSGIYFCQLQTEEGQALKAISVLK